jgi:hypothetical protein
MLLTAAASTAQALEGWYTALPNQQMGTSGPGVHPVKMRTNQSIIGFATTEPIPVSGCALSDMYTVPNQYNASAVLTLLLFAYSNNLTVDIYIKGCDSLTGRPLVTDVQLH